MKEELLEIAKAKTDLRIQEALKAIKASQLAANEETKSSAGDKYETGRAMAQNDRNLYARQLSEAQKDMAILNSIDLKKEYTLISTGALTETSIGYFFIATSIGIIPLKNQKVMVTSQDSPMGLILKGKRENDQVDFRNNKINIISVK
ncbi:MAG: transcription elongation factor [Cytophagales bacterium]|nr:transcription elongation factor [Cytophagales bacterium]